MSKPPTAIEGEHVTLAGLARSWSVIVVGAITHGYSIASGSLAGSCHGGDHLTPVGECFDPWALARPTQRAPIHFLLGSRGGAAGRTRDLTPAACEIHLTDQ